MPDATVHSYPFPEGSDPVAAGATDIENMANFLDVYAVLTASDSVPNGGAGVTWDSILASSDFALGTQYVTNDVLVYTGPGRFFTWWAKLRWTAQVSGTRGHLLEVNPASPSFVGLEETVDLASPANTYFYRSGIIPLQTNDKLWLKGIQSSGGAVALESTLVVVAL